VLDGGLQGPARVRVRHCHGIEIARGGQGCGGSAGAGLEWGDGRDEER
jgi:hypothetical protein